MQKFRIISTAMTAFLFYGSFAQGQPPVKEVGGFHHPESVYQSGNVLYVSDIGESMEPVKKDGDGFIGKVDLLTGKLVDAHFLPMKGGLNAPKGMAMDGNILYIADVDHIVGFDVVSRQQVAEIPIAGTGFLNDLVMGEGKLYASATDNGKIYEIDLTTKEYKPLPLKDSIEGANGLCYDKANQRLFCVSIGNWNAPDGTVYVIDLHKYTMKMVVNYFSLLDGVALAGNTLYFSDWGKTKGGKGRLLSLDLAKHLVTPLPSADEIAGPADFALSSDQKYFIVPEMLEGKILFIHL